MLLCFTQKGATFSSIFSILALSKLRKSFAAIDWLISPTGR